MNANISKAVDNIREVTYTSDQVAEVLGISPLYVNRVVDEDKWGLAAAKLKIFDRVVLFDATIVDAAAAQRQEEMSAAAERKAEREAEAAERKERSSGPTLKDLQAEAKDLGVPYYGLNKEALTQRIEDFQNGDYVPASVLRQQAAAKKKADAEAAPAPTKSRRRRRKKGSDDPPADLDELLS
jgi:hypothetical protein